MSGMADEMQARINADGGAGLPDGAGVVPGNEGGSQPSPAPPAAEPSTTDTGAGSGPPDTIPYARFKEVNDRYGELKGFEELVSYGYDADSLRRLAAFEAGYLQDPVGTVRSMAETLELPQSIIDAITAHQAGAAGDGDGRAGGQTSGEQPTPTELPPEIKQRLEYVDRLQEREQEAAREAQLQAVVQAWDELDAKDEVKTPERMKLMAIAQTAAQGGDFRTYKDLAVAARESVLEYRSEVLGSAVQQNGRRGSPPPALPGSTPAATGPAKFRSIREATRQAEADIAAGRLPSLNP